MCLNYRTSPRPRYLDRENCKQYILNTMDHLRNIVYCLNHSRYRLSGYRALSSLERSFSLIFKRENRLLIDLGAARFAKK